jgi:hypothetical protein
MRTTEQLTEREQQVLDHLRKARELGSTLVEYACAFGLNVKELYAVKQQLVRRGAIAGKPKAQEPDQFGPFAPVRIAPSMSSAVVCRLVHPSGWVMECGSFPPASWIATVLAGGAHAAA